MTLLKDNKTRKDGHQCKRQPIYLDSRLFQTFSSDPRERIFRCFCFKKPIIVVTQNHRISPVSSGSPRKIVEFLECEDCRK